MREKTEYVEVTVKVPKPLMEMLEQEHYFGWNRQDFFVAAVKTRISCEMSEMDMKEAKALKAKYGCDIGFYTVDSVKHIKHEVAAK